MKALRIIASIVLTAVLAATGLAAEVLALARFTVLTPDFYGAGEHEAYGRIAELAVREFSRLAVKMAPADVLRTTNPEEAYALAAKAMPPDELATMLEGNAPDVAQYLLEGGSTPMLRGYTWLQESQQAAIQALLRPNIWELLRDKPELPYLIPFTPKWNAEYGGSLERSMIVPRFYIGVYDNALIAVGALALGAAWLLSLVWRRGKRPFYAITGMLLLINCLLFLLPAILLTFFAEPIIQACLTPGLLGGMDMQAAVGVVRAGVWPFRDIFFSVFLVSFSFFITQFATGIDVKKEEYVRVKQNLETL